MQGSNHHQLVQFVNCGYNQKYKCSIMFKKKSTQFVWFSYETTVDCLPLICCFWLRNSFNNSEKCVYILHETFLLSYKLHMTVYGVFLLVRFPHSSKNIEQIIFPHYIADSRDGYPPYSSKIPSIWFVKFTKAKRCLSIREAATRLSIHIYLSVCMCG